MSEWQYSPEGRRQLVRRAGRHSIIMSAALVAGGALYTGLKYGWAAAADAWRVLAFGFLVFAGPFYVVQRRRAKSDAAALRISLTPEALTVDNGHIRLAITPQEAAGLTDTPDGVRVSGPDLSHSFFFLKHIERFDEFRAELEHWVPPGVPRRKSGHLFGLILWVAILGPVALMFLALGINDPVSGAILCFLSATLYLAAGVAAALSPAIPKRTRRFLWVLIFPIGGLVQRGITHFQSIGI